MLNAGRVRHRLFNLRPQFQKQPSKRVFPIGGVNAAAKRVEERVSVIDVFNLRRIIIKLTLIAACH